MEAARGPQAETHSHRASPALRGPPVETGLEDAIGH